jgi:hypothetical protein
MDQASVQKTAVNTPFGLFEYNRMPYGLCNASQTFQRQMNELFGQLAFVFVYIDDILVFSNNEREHTTHLEEIFKILSQNSMKISLHKCEFEKSSLDFLGYNISANGMRPCRKKCEAINDIELPSTIQELNSFLCTINFYRKHIPQFANKSKLLYDYMKDSPNKKMKITLSDAEVLEFVWYPRQTNLQSQQMHLIEQLVQCFIRSLTDRQKSFNSTREI